MFIRSKENVVRRDKIKCLIKCLAPKSCLEVILKDCQLPRPRYLLWNIGIFVFSNVDIYFLNFVGVLDRNLRTYLYY